MAVNVLIIGNTSGRPHIITYSGYVCLYYVTQRMGVGYLGCGTELIWL